MRMFVSNEAGTRPVLQMTFQQTRQAASIMDCIGRLIPQEGVDYDVDIIFKGDYDPALEIAIRPHTDKGEWWKEYVSHFIKKYPPRIENPEEAIQERPEKEESVDEKELP